MTAVQAATVRMRATRLERVILALTARVERAVNAQVERRVRVADSVTAHEQMSNARADACAQGSIGILPR